MSEITFRLEYKNPVLVADFCEALASIADEYNRIKALQERPDEDAYDIYVSRITDGSIIAYLKEYGPYAMALVEGFNTSGDFITHWRDIMLWLKTKAGPKPELHPEQLENAIRFVNPVTRDSAASITLAGNTFNGPVSIMLNSKEASEVKSNAQVELNEMGRTSFEIRQKVALRWYQARNDTKSKSGDRAIVEELYPKSVKTTFLNEGLKARLIGANENPFKSTYAVDIAVEAIGSRPTKYQIIDVHGIIA